MVLPVDLTVMNLGAFLSRRYPDRDPGHPDPMEDLVEELLTAGYTSVEEVAQMLERTNDAFLAEERASKPTGDGGDEGYIGIGVVRMSLAIDKRVS
jgi:hypothetical protein